MSVPLLIAPRVVLRSLSSPPRAQLRFLSRGPRADFRGHAAISTGDKAETRGLCGASDTHSRSSIININNSRSINNNNSSSINSIINNSRSINNISSIINNSRSNNNSSIIINNSSIINNNSRSINNSIINNNISSNNITQLFHDSRFITIVSLSHPHFILSHYSSSDAFIIVRLAPALRCDVVQAQLIVPRASPGEQSRDVVGECGWSWFSWSPCRGGGRCPVPRPRGAAAPSPPLQRLRPPLSGVPLRGWRGPTAAATEQIRRAAGRHRGAGPRHPPHVRGEQERHGAAQARHHARARACARVSGRDGTIRAFLKQRPSRQGSAHTWVPVFTVSTTSCHKRQSFYGLGCPTVLAGSALADGTWYQLGAPAALRGDCRPPWMLC